MYVRELGEPDETAAAGAAARLRVAEKFFQTYKTDCQGISLPLTLSKTALSWRDQERLLEKRIQDLPKILEDKADLDRRQRLWSDKRVFGDPTLEARRVQELIDRTGALSPKAWQIEMFKLAVRAGYPAGYAFDSLARELARAKCALSKHRWKEWAPCDGQEEDETETISQQVAEHFVSTELGQQLKSQTIKCDNAAKWCEVNFPNGITINVSFADIPSRLVATQIKPNLGVSRGYEYLCPRIPPTFPSARPVVSLKRL